MIIKLLFYTCEESYLKKDYFITGQKLAFKIRFHINFLLPKLISNGKSNNPPLNKKFLVRLEKVDQKYFANIFDLSFVGFTFDTSQHI